MGGFSSNYEGGYLDFDDAPKWMDKDAKQKNKYAHLMQKKIYHERNGSHYRYLNMLLTSSNLLRPTEQEKRTQLCEIDDSDVILKLKHNKNHPKDDKNLEVYHEEIFIGSVQKIFEDEEIDNTTTVNAFCFLDNTLKDIEVLWDGEDFFLKQKVD